MTRPTDIIKLEFSSHYYDCVKNVLTTSAFIFLFHFLRHSYVIFAIFPTFFRFPMNPAIFFLHFDFVTFVKYDFMHQNVQSSKKLSAASCN